MSDDNHRLVGKTIQGVNQAVGEGGIFDGAITLYFTDGTSARIDGGALFSGDVAFVVEHFDHWIGSDD